MDHPSKDYAPISTPCETTAEPQAISSDKRTDKSLSWGEMLAQSATLLAADPIELAKIEKRGF